MAARGKAGARRTLGKCWRFLRPPDVRVSSLICSGAWAFELPPQRPRDDIAGAPLARERRA